jgi:hypothetical protein
MKRFAEDAFPWPTCTTPGDAPAPLGEAPSYDQILDVALEFTFPGSDPIAVQTACEDAERDGRTEDAPGRMPSTCD